MHLHSNDSVAVALEASHFELYPRAQFENTAPRFEAEIADKCPLVRTIVGELQSDIPHVLVASKSNHGTNDVVCSLFGRRRRTVVARQSDNYRDARDNCPCKPFQNLPFPDVVLKDLNYIIA